jgi:hypothetical protein
LKFPFRLSRKGRKSAISNSVAIAITVFIVTLIAAVAYEGGLFTVNYGVLSNNGSINTNSATTTENSSTGNSLVIITETVTKTVTSVSTTTVYWSPGNNSGIEVGSIVLYSGTTSNSSLAGTAAFEITFNNPGAPTYITSITLAGGGLSPPINSWDNNSAAQTKKNLIIFNSPHVGNNYIAGDTNTTLIFYPTTMSDPVESIAKGQSYSYLIEFADGESIAAQVVSQ